MSGRDHETNHDGECFKECRECRIKELEKEVERLKQEVENLKIDLACEIDGEGY